MYKPLQMISIGLAGVLVGIMLGVMTAGGDREEAPERPTITDRTERADTDTDTQEEAPADTERTAPPADLAEVEPELVADLRSRLVEAEGDRVVLRNRIRELEDERDVLTEQLEKWRPKPRSPLPVEFGPWPEIEDIANADWDELGGAAGDMTPILVELEEAIRRGESLPQARLEELQQHNMKLVRHHLLLNEKLPTHAQVNGEFSHPISLANMLDAQLKQAGHPLTDVQRAAISAHGKTFDALWERAQQGYTDSTFRLEKIIEEVELKQWFNERMMSELTSEQRETAVPSQIAGYVGLDLYSPGLLFQASMMPVTERDEQELPDALKDRLEDAYGLATERLDAAEHLFTHWLQQYPAKQATGHEGALFHVDEVLAAARGQLAVMKELHAVYAETDEQRAAIASSATVFVPRLLMS
jgi:hypothetical protein